MFKDTAVESLTLSIELFNRPSALARDHAVVMMLAHSFEMLLKASIYQHRGSVRDKGDQLSHSLARCLEISLADLGTITSEEKALLTAIKQDRDAATHDTIMMSDDLLWLHMRAGITVFRRLLQDEFDVDLANVLPNRVIPVSAAPPADLHELVEQELETVRSLLAKGKRRTAEAAARLRPLLSLDGSATGRSDRPTDAEVQRAERALRGNAPWQAILPGLATLQIGTAAPGGDAQEVVLKIGKDKGAIPVRRAASGEEAEALAHRGVSPFEEYSVKLSSFGEKLGLSRHEGYALIETLALKGDDRAYFVKRTANGGVIYQGLSARALELGRKALQDPSMDLQTIVQQYQQARSRKKGSRKR
ncbi:DUF3644 domain-containing protein [Motilibacter peucedani]